MSSFVTLIPPLIVGGIAGFTFSSNFFNWLYSLAETKEITITSPVLDKIRDNELLEKAIIALRFKGTNKLHVWEGRIIKCYFFSELFLILPFLGFGFFETAPVMQDNLSVFLPCLLSLLVAYGFFLLALFLTFFLYTKAISEPKGKSPVVPEISDRKHLEEQRQALKAARNPADAPAGTPE
ncbi:MAG: hypothetical protein LUQ66_07530 [Methanoregula sp.]|nr:hypothetical protein [Methanoregula sp.]